MKNLLIVSHLALLALLARLPLAGIAAFGATVDRPNVLFIMTDQHHAKMLSAAGNPYLKTHALDSIAASGVRFANAYVTNPVCVPSRISLATGLMASRMGVLNNGMKATVSEEIQANSMGMLMKKAGYDTFYGGKSHLPKELDPSNAGYDEIVKDQRDKLAPACVEFMARKRDKPFFAVASFINPHDICFVYNAGKPDRKGLELVDDLYRQAQALPEEALPPLPDNSGIPEREPDGFDEFLKVDAVTPAKLMRKDYTDRDWRNYRWIYCRLTERVDAQIGELMQGLKDNGLEENTLVIFTADHGDMDGAHRLASKGVFYEESVGVPYMMQYKGVIPAGVVDDRNLVSTGLDTLPTICDFVGISIPDHMLGQSLRSVAAGQKSALNRSFVVAENHTGRMVRSSRYKYCVYNVGENRESLVDLQKDPGEMKNLAGNPEYEATLKRHRALLQEWIDSSRDEDAKAFAIP